MYNTAKGTNTVNVIASCRILSCGNVNCVYPIRFAGTCSMYSKKAINQLSTAATYHFRSPRLRRCAYQAKVMNTFDAISSAVVRRTTVGILQTGDGELQVS